MRFWEVYVNFVILSFYIFILKLQSSWIMKKYLKWFRLYLNIVGWNILSDWRELWYKPCVFPYQIKWNGKKRWQVDIVSLFQYCTNQMYAYSNILVQPLSCVHLFTTPGTVACQASLSFNISLSLLKLMSFKSVMPSNHLVLRIYILIYILEYISLSSSFS